jgi:hypothetical protein
MKRSVERELNWGALAGLIFVLLGTVVALWAAWQHYVAAPTMHQVTRARGWSSGFGEVATVVLAFAVPSAIALFRKAFLSQFRLRS